jgi:hypothetical protein
LTSIVRAHLGALPWGLYTANGKGTQHRFMRYDVFLTSCGAKSSSVIPQLPLSPRFAKFCHLTIDGVARKHQLNKDDLKVRPPRGRRHLGEKAEPFLLTNGVELKRLFKTKVEQVTTGTGDLRKANSLTPQEWQSHDWISVDPGRAQIVTAVRHYHEPETTHRTSRPKKTEALQRSQQSEYILQKKQWSDLCGFTKSKQRIKYRRAHNPAYAAILTQLSEEQQRTPNLEVYSRYCQRVAAGWGIIWAEHNLLGYRKLRFERFQKQQRALEIVARGLIENNTISAATTSVPVIAQWVSCGEMLAWAQRAKVTLVPRTRS